MPKYPLWNKSTAIKRLLVTCNIKQKIHFLFLCEHSVASAAGKQSALSAYARNAVRLAAQSSCNYPPAQGRLLKEENGCEQRLSAAWFPYFTYAIKIISHRRRFFDVLKENKEQQICASQPFKKTHWWLKSENQRFGYQANLAMRKQEKQICLCNSVFFILFIALSRFWGHSQFL